MHYILFAGSFYEKGNKFLSLYVGKEYIKMAMQNIQNDAQTLIKLLYWDSTSVM